MPDVSRSDSNRSDASRPRVSFNRDVHVKRINGPRTANAYSLAPDGTGFVPTVVRREVRPKSKRQITKEAEAVLKQADKITCKPVSDPPGRMDDEKPEPKKKRKDSFLSLTRKKDKDYKNGSSDFDSGSSQEYRVYKVNERKIDKARDFASLDRKKLKRDKKNQNLEYLSLEQNGEKQEIKPKPKISLPEERLLSAKKKQLSPIIESPGTDYFGEKNNSKVGKMIKQLTEKSGTRRNKPPPTTGTAVLKAPGEDRSHNDNKPFSYTENKKEDSESLDGKEDSESTSPTNDVIYAQVVVSGRDGNVQKTTVHARIASNEVGRNLVGEPDRSRVGLDYKIESNREDGIYETLDGNKDEMWKQKSDFLGKKEKFESFASSPQSELYGENPGRRDLYRRKSIETDRRTPSPLYEGRIRVASKYDPLRRTRNRSNSPSTDLRDLSIRREILLSRSESLAKERYNSLKRLREPVRIKKRTSDGIDGTSNYRYLGNDIRVNDSFSTSLRKIPKDVELVKPIRTKRSDSGSDSYLKEKQQVWKSNEKLHTLTKTNENNLLNKLTKLGKSKSFIEEKPRSRKIEKVKSLFRKKKDGKGSESEDDPLSSRYIEYRGSDLDLSDAHPEVRF